MAANKHRLVRLCDVAEAIRTIRVEINAIQSVCSYTKPQTTSLIEHIKPRLIKICEIIDAYSIYDLQVELARCFDLLDECKAYLGSRLDHDKD
jgi:hypothetical protein